MLDASKINIALKPVRPTCGLSQNMFLFVEMYALVLNNSTNTLEDIIKPYNKVKCKVFFFAPWFLYFSRIKRTLLWKLYLCLHPEESLYFVAILRQNGRLYISWQENWLHWFSATESPHGTLSMKQRNLLDIKGIKQEFKLWARYLKARWKIRPTFSDRKLFIKWYTTSKRLV